MAEETGVSVITIQHTYEILCEEGYVEARQRSGYFVIYKEKDFISSSEIGEKSINHVENTHRVKNVFPFTVLTKTMRRVLTEYGEEILVKSPNHGCMMLRQAIAAYLNRSSDILVKPEQIIIGSGAEYLYSLIAQLLGKNRIFALENPSYDKIRKVYEANGVVCDMLKLSRDGIKTSELERTEATVLHVTPFNSYPSAITAGATKRFEYLSWARKRSGYIIEDNYDSELTISKKR
jgi:GntR family transcriptional regulator/MocR family aminotransferase